MPPGVGWQGWRSSSTTFVDRHACVGHRDVRRIPELAGYNAAVLLARTAFRALLPFALHGLAREVDAAVGLLLRTDLDLPGFVGEALGLLELGGVLWSILVWTCSGAILWLVLAALRAHREGLPLGRALAEEAPGFDPLYLRPAITLIALLALAMKPTFPYGFTLPVALTQDWGVAQDAAALAALFALRWPALRLPAPNAGSVFFLAFLVYALLSPPRAREWEGHPGNEPKTLRMAVALGHDLKLDVEGVSASMEELTPRPLLESLKSASATVLHESLRMVKALGQGTEVFKAQAIRATRITRQTIRGKEGGVYHVLAPGPSLLLAPTLRIDRALNKRFGVEGRLGVTLLVWNALAAALVAALFLLLRDATGRAGLSAALAGSFGLFPPYVFYSFQFYPEMLGALGMAIVLRLLLFVPRYSVAMCWLLGVLLAFLPWLHQKFLPIWAVLVVMALVRFVDEMVTIRALAGLLLPQILTLFLTALYNFAITGSVRPDALFLAWGPGGVTTARMGQGLLGLLLDARYGILPYAPLYLLAAGGLLMAGRGASRLRWALPAVAVYHLTVASADNWSGAVCNLGRYAMPATVLFIALAAIALEKTAFSRGVLTLALTLWAWTALIALALWRDPHAANDSALLLAKSVFADGNVYIPNLFLRSWGEGAPGLAVRIAAWVLLSVGLGVWLRRIARQGRASSPVRVLAGLAVAALATGLLLERWPTSRTMADFHDGIEVGDGVTVFVAGPARVEADRALTEGGDLELLVRAKSPLTALSVTLEGQGSLRVPGLPLAAGSGEAVEMPLSTLRILTGRRGLREIFSRQRLEVKTRGQVALRFQLAQTQR